MRTFGKTVIRKPPVKAFLGIREAIFEEELRVPDNVALVSFDDTMIAFVT